MRRIALLTLSLVLVACSSEPDVELARIHAADAFTQRYSHSRLGKWNVRASAAGTDCGVLLVQTGIILDASTVEALHYGTGAYDVYTGGVERFSKDSRFRGVAYQDSSGRIRWPYAVATTTDPDALTPCQ